MQRQEQIDKVKTQMMQVVFLKKIFCTFRSCPYVLIIVNLAMCWNCRINFIKKMTTFIKTKFNNSDDQTNIDNMSSCKYYRISKLIFQNSWRKGNYFM